jgi:F-box and WD-40 domain protein 1/11
MCVLSKVRLLIESIFRKHHSSKDTLIRVWNRQSLDLETTLRGHEGPVNAVGLQGDRLVSASGDGKMMLWDIPSGKRIRTFEGHDRGLACIEYKVGLMHPPDFVYYI